MTLSIITYIIISRFLLIFDFLKNIYLKARVTKRKKETQRDTERSSVFWVTARNYDRFMAET